MSAYRAMTFPDVEMETATRGPPSMCSPPYMDRASYWATLHRREVVIMRDYREDIWTIGFIVEMIVAISAVIKQFGDMLN